MAILKSPQHTTFKWWQYHPNNAFRLNNHNYSARLFRFGIEETQPAVARVPQKQLVSFHNELACAC